MAREVFTPERACELGLAREVFTRSERMPRVRARAGPAMAERERVVERARETRNARLRPCEGETRKTRNAAW